LNGTVRIGLDDLIRKIFGRIDRVELPETGRKIARGETLFSIDYGDYSLKIPSPISGKIAAVNTEHTEHPEWLAIKPFELSWMCGIEPSDLAGELPGLRIGMDAVNWYQEELARYSELAGQFESDAARPALEATGDGEQGGNAENLKLLAEFAEPFLQC
jgi:glycine cleavage system H lipoate-binding protein